MLKSISQFAIAMVVVATSLTASAADYAIDAAHTGVSFQIAHGGISWTHGRFNSVSGAFTVDPASPASQKFAMTIEAASIDTNNAQRDDHLKSPDFFNVKQFPSITFESTKVEPAEGGLKVTGNMTLHGVTKPITFELKGGKSIEFPAGVERIGYSTAFKLKRSEYGMANMLEAIGDDVFVNISFEGTKQK